MEHGKVVQIDILAEKVKVKVGNDDDFKYETYKVGEISIETEEKK